MANFIPTITLVLTVSTASQATLPSQPKGSLCGNSIVDSQKSKSKPLIELYSIGPALVQKLNKIGIHVVSDFQNHEPSQLLKIKGLGPQKLATLEHELQNLGVQFKTGLDSIEVLEHLFILTPPQRIQFNRRGIHTFKQLSKLSKSTLLKRWPFVGENTIALLETALWQRGLSFSKTPSEARKEFWEQLKAKHSQALKRYEVESLDGFAMLYREEVESLFGFTKEEFDTLERHLADMGSSFKRFLSTSDKLQQRRLSHRSLDLSHRNQLTVREFLYYPTSVALVFKLHGIKTLSQLFNKLPLVRVGLNKKEHGEIINQLKELGYFSSRGNPNADRLSLTNLPSIGPELIKRLNNIGIHVASDFQNHEASQLLKINGLGPKRLATLEHELQNLGVFFKPARSSNREIENSKILGPIPLQRLHQRGIYTFKQLSKVNKRTILKKWYLVGEKTIFFLEAALEKRGLSFARTPEDVRREFWEQLNIKYSQLLQQHKVRHLGGFVTFYKEEVQLLFGFSNVEFDALEQHLSDMDTSFRVHRTKSEKLRQFRLAYSSFEMIQKDQLSVNEVLYYPDSTAVFFKDHDVETIGQLINNLSLAKVSLNENDYSEIVRQLNELGCLKKETEGRQSNEAPDEIYLASYSKHPQRIFLKSQDRKSLQTQYSLERRLQYSIYILDLHEELLRFLVKAHRVTSIQQLLDFGLERLKILPLTQILGENVFFDLLESLEDLGLPLDEELWE